MHKEIPPLSIHSETYSEGPVKTGFILKTIFYFCVLVLISCVLSRSLKAKDLELTQLEKAVLSYSQLEAQEINSLKKRSKIAPLLPKLGLGYNRKIGTQINNQISDSISVTSTAVTLGPPDTSFSQDDDLNSGFEVKATWDLSALIFNKDMLDVSAESRYRNIQRMQVLDELHALYFERKKILLDRSKEDLSQIQQLKIDEIEAKLDAMSGGEFSKIQAQNTKENPHE